MGPDHRGVARPMSPALEMGQGHRSLSTAAALVADARHDFDRLARELVDHVEAAGGRWVGHGGSAFAAVGVAWATRQRTIVAALDGFADALRAVERDNTATDDAQSAAFARCQRRLS